MKYNRVFIALLTLFAGAFAVAFGQGSGELGIGYTFMDETGNLSVNQGSFNEYEGVGISLENFYYRFNNGININADLQNLTLDNRNIRFGLSKPGFFGMNFNHSQYRRFYDFNGDNYTERKQTGGSVWIMPIKQIKLFASGRFVNRQGEMVELFDFVESGAPTSIDYDMRDFKTGIQINHHGNMIRMEYLTMKYETDLSTTEQDRKQFRIHGFFPIYRFEWIKVHGGFQSFESEYTDTDRKIESNTGWGGVNVDLPHNFELKYSFIFDRTRASSDTVATDNIAHNFYLSHTMPGKLKATVGYQNGIQDDYDNAVKANHFYLGLWSKPIDKLTVRGSYGSGREDVDEGTRHIGDEERTRIKFSAKYNDEKWGILQLKYNSKSRENKDLSSDIEYNQFDLHYTLPIIEYASATIGYTNTIGEFENAETAFEFCDNIYYADLNSEYFKKFNLGFGLDYYRSKRDLDVESINLRFNGSYTFAKGYTFGVEYKVHNFDDLLYYDQYYTGNIVTVKLSKSLNFN
ncbi:MAG: hypothetical protein ABIJ45_07880 [Candidatus Zixiibacteriota bacterium]